MKKVLCLNRLLLLPIVLFSVLTVQAQEYQRRWGLQFEMGGQSFENADEGTYDFYPDDDQSNTFALTADYYIKPRLALTGGLHFSQAGILTDFADGLGLKKVNTMGFQTGAKYYFFPPKWICQPYVGAGLYFNFLNWNVTGHGTYTAENGYPNQNLELDWKVKNAFASVSPRLGIELRVISSLSLTCAFDYRIPFYGSTQYNARFVSGSMAGMKTHVKDTYSAGFSIGLKMDFPVRPVSKKSANTLFDLLWIWINSKAY